MHLRLINHQTFTWLFSSSLSQLVFILCLTDNPVPEPSGGACLLGTDKKTRNKLIGQEVTEKCAFQKSELCNKSQEVGQN